MTYRKTANFRIDSLAGVLIFVALLVAMFFFLAALFRIMLWIAPLLLIAAFIIDRSVVINYGKWLVKTVKTNPLLGIGAILFTLLGYMVVFPFLFAKALLKRKIKDVNKKHEQQQQGELIDFEEIESKRNTQLYELPRLEKKERQRSEYDNLFE